MQPAVVEFRAPGSHKPLTLEFHRFVGWSCKENPVVAQVFNDDDDLHARSESEGRPDAVAFVKVVDLLRENGFEVHIVRAPEPSGSDLPRLIDKAVPGHAFHEEEFYRDQGRFSSSPGRPKGSGEAPKGSTSQGTPQPGSRGEAAGPAPGSKGEAAGPVAPKHGSAPAPKAAPQHKPQARRASERSPAEAVDQHHAAVLAHPELHTVDDLVAAKQSRTADRVLFVPTWNEHRDAVFQALSEGRPTSPEARAEHPSLGGTEEETRNALEFWRNGRRAPEARETTPTPAPKTHNFGETLRHGRFNLKYDAPERVNEVLRKSFGLDLDDESLHDIAISLSPEDRINIFTGPDDSVSMYVWGERHHAARTLSKLPDGSKICHNSSFAVNDPKAKRSGFGFDAFSRQVAALKKKGFVRIDTLAAGNIRTAKSGYNGYYTWPRLGYDGLIPTRKLNQLPLELKERMAGRKNIQALFETPEGRAWWLQKGHQLTLSFDLREGSLSNRVLEAYTKERSQRLQTGEKGWEDEF